MDFYFDFCRCVFQNNLSLIHFQSMKQFIEETIFKACNLFKHYGRREKIYRSVVCYDKCTNIELCVFFRAIFSSNAHFVQQIIEFDGTFFMIKTENHQTRFTTLVVLYIYLFGNDLLTDWGLVSHSFPLHMTIFTA